MPRAYNRKQMRVLPLISHRANFAFCRPAASLVNRPILYANALRLAGNGKCGARMGNTIYPRDDKHKRHNQDILISYQSRGKQIFVGLYKMQTKSKQTQPVFCFINVKLKKITV